MTGGLEAARIGGMRPPVPREPLWNIALRVKHPSMFHPTAESLSTEVETGDWRLETDD